MCETPESRIPEPRTTSFGVSVDPHTGHRYRDSTTLRPPTLRPYQGYGFPPSSRSVASCGAQQTQNSRLHGRRVPYGHNRPSDQPHQRDATSADGTWSPSAEVPSSRRCRTGNAPAEMTVLAPHETFTCDSESHLTREEVGLRGRPPYQFSMPLAPLPIWLCSGGQTSTRSTTVTNFVVRFG